MKIFLDTEFTDFTESECDLISIGLVADDGREFYAELTDYRQEVCTDFVRQVVLPLMKQHKNTVVGNRLQVAKELAEWLDPYKHNECIICFDYNTDWYLMASILQLLPDDMLPDFLTTKNIWGDIDKMAIDYYWLEADCLGHKPHHALWDARGNKYAYRGT